MITNPKAGIPNAHFIERSIDAHFNHGQHVDCTDGETIINNTDEPDGIYLIKSGFVKAYTTSETGQNSLLFIHQMGDFIPLPWALNGAHLTGLSYEAIESVVVLRISKDYLRKAMGRDTWLTQEILEQIVEVITVYTQRIQTLQFRSARRRIISEILNLAQRFGKMHGKVVTIFAPVTQQDLADSINMNRETASRALGLLVREGLIEQADHLISILDLPKMQIALSTDD